MDPVTAILLLLLLIGVVVWLLNKGMTVLIVAVLVALVALLLGYA